MDNKTFTLTIGDRAENHKGMQIIGEKSKNGFSYEDLINAKNFFENKNCECDLVELHNNINKKVNNAYLLIIRNGVNKIIDKTADDLFYEQDNLEKDTKAYMYGRVVNKSARYNLCFGKYYQKADYENGKGTIIKLEDVPLLNEILKKLPGILGDNAKNLVVEGNYYYDITKCGIGYHGDSERSKVIGIRLGESLPICFQWYYKNLPVGDNMKYIINHGDIYIMSEKAVGFDWKKKNSYTLRHSAGCEKFTSIKISVLTNKDLKINNEIDTSNFADIEYIYKFTKEQLVKILGINNLNTINFCEEIYYEWRFEYGHDKYSIYSSSLEENIIWIIAGNSTKKNVKLLYDKFDDLLN